MSESSSNLETLDKKDICKQCLCFNEARCGPCTEHFEDGLFKLDELNKDISGHFQNLKACSFNIFFFVLHAYPKQCRLRILQDDPFTRSVYWSITPS